MSITQSTPEIPAPDPRAWLDHIPAHRRGVIANWFHDSVRKGAHEPRMVLSTVRQICDRRLHWGDETDATTALTALDTDPEGARVYAQSVIDYEALPLDARRRVKAERAFAYLKEVMAAKPVTTAQLAYLRALGYHGAPPHDRAHASELIERLKKGRVQP